jgi:hypothetical protein
MFKLADIIRYLTFISYVGFIISSISGLSIVVKTFDLCKLLISCIVIINTPIIIYLDITNTNKADSRVIHYCRAYTQFILSFMIMGLSNIGLGFSFYGLTICISNLLLGVFDCEDNIIHPIIVNPDNQINTNNQN